MKNISEKKTIDVIGVNFSPIATFKQGDAAVLKLELFKNGEVFNITGQTVKLGAYRPNKTIVEQLDGFTIDNNALTINLKNNILAVHGIVEVDLTLTDSTGEMTTASFYLKVNKKVLGSDNIAASDEIDSLKQIKLDLTALNENVKREENTRVANEKIRVSEEKTRKTNETERVNFYEGVAKPLVEDLNQYDKKIEDIYHTIRENDYLPFEGENITVDHSLKGMTKDMKIGVRTLQNISPVTFSTQDKSQFVNLNNQYIFEEGYLTVTVDGQQGWLNAFSKPIDLIKPNTIYTLIIDVKENTLNKDFVVVSIDTDNPPFTGQYAVRSGEKGIVTKKLLTKEDLGVSTVGIRSYMPPNTTGTIKLRYMLLEVDWTNKETPTYFEGIKSVGEKEGTISILSTGKNLVNQKLWENTEMIDGVECLVGDGWINSDGSTGNPIILPLNKPIRNGRYYLLSNNKATTHFNKFTLYNTKTRAGKVFNTNSTLNQFVLTKATVDISNEEFNAIMIDTGNAKANGYIENIYFSEIESNEFIPYKENKKEILLPFEGGFKGLPNGVCDTLENRDDGVYLVQRVKQYIFDGSSDESWRFYAGNGTVSDTYISFRAFLGESIIYGWDNTKAHICDRFIPKVATECSWNHSGEGITSDDFKTIFITIERSKLTTQDENGFRAWLQANPTTVYCGLKQSIVTKLDISSLNLETFKDITHVFSENSISPNLSFKAPVNVPATISTLRTRNESLEQENKELKEEVSVKTLKLHGQDVELTNSDLDLDFRIFELEMSIGLPINLNMKGMRNMARSPFEMMKILVLNNNYDREDIEYKASRYLQGKRMTQAEYDEIISLMDANELVK